MWGRSFTSAGLCPQCAHSKVIVSDRGSQFTLCQLSKQDPQFPKYPRLPVRTCAGFAPQPDAPPQP
jgi:hypothetical protein